MNIHQPLSHVGVYETPDSTRASGMGCGGIVVEFEHIMHKTNSIYVIEK